MRPPPLLAVAVSAALGVVLGIGSGVVLDRGGQRSFTDPLSLGIHLENQSCTGGTLLVVAAGNAAPSLAPAVAVNPHLSYLDTRESCGTAWMQHGGAPHYVAYLGPYASREQACALRMTAAHRGDFVTRLHEGDVKPVRCLCYQAYSAMPLLRSGAQASVLDGIWTRAMQRVLTDLGYLSKGHVTGFFGVATVDAVKQFQHAQGLRFTGVFNSASWQALVSKGCRLYKS